MIDMRKAVASLTGVLVGCVAIGVALQVSGPSSATTPTATRAHAGANVDGGSVLDLVKPGEPCINPERTTLDALMEYDGSPAWMPSSALASSTTLSQAWLCGSDPVLTFGGVMIDYEPGWDLDDPAARWSEMAKQWGHGYEATIMGRPGFVDPVSAKAPRGEVLVVVKGTLIRIAGDGSLSTDQLVGVAESLETGVSVTAVDRAPAAVSEPQ